jgi:hypothetical protein
MMMVRRIGVLATVCCSSLVGSGAAYANRLDPYWQSERDFFNDLSD